MTDIDFARAAKRFDDVAASYKGRQRADEIPRAAVAAACATILRQKRLPESLEEILVASGLQRDFSECRVALRTAVSDVGERLVKLQDADSTPGQRYALRSNGQILVIAPRGQMIVTDRLLELLELCRLTRFEDSLAHYMTGGRNPETWGWRDVLDVDDELNELITEENVGLARNVALTVVGQAVSLAIAMHVQSKRDVGPLLAVGVHARTKVQPPGMWLEKSPLARLVLFAYGSSGVHVQRLVYVDRQTLNKDRSTLTTYLTLLKGIGVEQRLLPLADNPETLPDDSLVIPGVRVLKYTRDQLHEYPFRTPWLWGSTKDDDINACSSGWDAKWDDAIPIDGRVDIALDALAHRVRGPNR